MLISKVGAEHYEYEQKKKKYNGRTAYGFRAIGRSENPGGGTSSNVVGII